LSKFGLFLLLFPNSNIFIGIKEKVKYKNLLLVGGKFRYLKEFIQKSKEMANPSIIRLDNYLKFIFNFPFEIPAKMTAPRDEKLKNKAIEYMKENGLTPGKTVILAPYSNSAWISKNIESIKNFEKIASYLISKGYTVCTNVDKINSKAIKGTIPISPTFDIIMDLAELCGYVIAYRSGFTDFVANSNTKLFVYYPKIFLYPQTTFYQYFSLSVIYDRPDIVEVEGDMEKFVEIVKNSF